MFNQTTSGWMHWSSLPDTAGFPDTEGCRLLNYCHGLYPASACAVLCHCMWWQSKLPMVGPACAKKNNFTRHFRMPLHTDHSSMVGPSTTQTRMPQSPIIQTLLAGEAGHRHRHQFLPLTTHMDGKNKTSVSEMPSRHRDEEERWDSSAHRVHW
jgi:hypothetical protein